MLRLAAFFLALCLAGCGTSNREGCCDISLVVDVPPDSGDVYIAGNLPQLGPWRPDGQKLSGAGARRTATVNVPYGYTFEYKFTLGSWHREMLDGEGQVPGNFELLADADLEVKHRIAQFKADPLAFFEDWRGADIAGRMVFWPDVESAFLEAARHVEIWLPPGYEEDNPRRYPVLYMHDGQNLFDYRRANTGVDWGVDEAIVRLAAAGRIDPPIVVGVWSTADRWLEYSPWHNAPEYARFLIEELKPRIDTQFRTRNGPANTAVMGSSMGGLLSYYLVTYHPDVFGACGCISTHFPISEHAFASYLADGDSRKTDRTPYILRDIAAGSTVPAGARYWFDYGSRGLDAQYGKTHRAVRKWLLAQGKVENADFVIREYPQADHNEAAWRARLEDPLVFLFGSP